MQNIKISIKPYTKAVTIKPVTWKKVTNIDITFQQRREPWACVENSISHKVNNILVASWIHNLLLNIFLWNNRNPPNSRIHLFTIQWALLYNHKIRKKTFQPRHPASTFLKFKKNPFQPRHSLYIVKFSNNPSQPLHSLYTASTYLNSIKTLPSPYTQPLHS